MQTEKQIKADAINGFVGSMVGAFESGFTDSSKLTLATLHRVAQNYCKDNYDIELPHITEQWGMHTAQACGFPLCAPSDEATISNQNGTKTTAVLLAD